MSCFCLFYLVFTSDKNRPHKVSFIYKPALSNISLFLVIRFIEVLEKEVSATCADEQWDCYGLRNLSFWHVHGCFVTGSVTLVVVDSVILVLFLGGELWLASESVRESKIATVFRIVRKCFRNFIFNVGQFLF